MTDRMLAIRGRPGNPEGVEIARFGEAVCYYSRTMPWPAFNTVKGLTGSSIGHIEAIISFYKERGRLVQFEAVPGMADQALMARLSELGCYPSAHHASLIVEPRPISEAKPGPISVRELGEDEFELYATVHCRGTGLPEDGIPHVAANNRILYRRPGWKFYLACVEGHPAAVGVLFMQSGRASLTFAATLPDYRGLGLHGRLLERRIHDAYVHGCRIAVSQCSYLSRSHRNMERAGMRLGYVRTSWTERRGPVG